MFLPSPLAGWVVVVAAPFVFIPLMIWQIMRGRNATAYPDGSFVLAVTFLLSFFLMMAYGVHMIDPQLRPNFFIGLIVNSEQR